MTALCLRILQASLVFVNTLMLQDVVAEPEWSALLTPVDRRGLSPLFWQHVRHARRVKVTVSGTTGPPRAKDRCEYCDPAAQGPEDGDVPESGQYHHAEEDRRQRSPARHAPVSLTGRLNSRSA